MNIMAKLAFNRLKINRSRTAWTLAAIALSTALITAVCSFAASGNAMVKLFLGENYGDYGSTYTGLFALPAIFLALLITAMSIVVISNVFRVSAGESTAQFGILKCVGATGRQIAKSVLWESVFLSAIGIPFGVLLGLGLTWGGIQVANHFLGELDALAHLMIQQVSLQLTFVVAWPALLAATFLSFGTVLISAWLPAKKAAKASALDSIRGTSEVRMLAFTTKPCVERLVQRVFGFEGTLAMRNLRRNRRNFRATVTSLCVGVVLFITLGALSDEANGIQKLMLPDMPETVIADYTSNWAEEADYLKTGSLYACPIDSREGNRIAEHLAEKSGTPIWGIGLDLSSYHAAVPDECLTPEMQDALKQQDADFTDFAVELITVDDIHYAQLCEKAGVPVGSVLLLNGYGWNNNGNEKYLAPFTEDLNAVTLQEENGNTTTYAIQGILMQEQIPAELVYFNTSPVRLVVPQATVRGYSWYAAPEDETSFIVCANNVLNEVFPEGQVGDYMQAGFSTRVYALDDYMKVMNIAIVLVEVFLYSFVALLMLIGFTNIINTLFTNVLMRAREFAVLQSVGMTPEGLRRMLSLESVLCAGKALALGLPVGVLATWLISIPVRAMYPIPYRFPLAWVLLSTVGVLALTWSITVCAGFKLSRQNIMEAIRTESGR